jgi:hypothetical protein
MAEKHNLSDKKAIFRLSRAVAVAVALRKICATPTT